MSLAHNKKVNTNNSDNNNNLKPEIILVIGSFFNMVRVLQAMGLNCIASDEYYFKHVINTKDIFNAIAGKGRYQDITLPIQELQKELKINDNDDNNSENQTQNKTHNHHQQPQQQQQQQQQHSNNKQKQKLQGNTNEDREKEKQKEKTKEKDENIVFDEKKYNESICEITFDRQLWRHLPNYKCVEFDKQWYYSIHDKNELPFVEKLEDLDLLPFKMVLNELNIPYNKFKYIHVTGLFGVSIIFFFLYPSLFFLQR